MNILFPFKAKKAVKQTKKVLDTNKDLTKEVKRVVGNLKSDVDTLLTLLPHLKPLYKDIVAIIKKVF